MKKIVIALFMLMALTINAQVTSFPYFENFDGSTSIPKFWVNQVDDNADGEDWIFSKPSGNVGQNPCAYGATADHTGKGNVAWIDDSPSPEGDPTNLITPSLNISGLSNPVLKFWYWIDVDFRGSSVLYVDIYVSGSWHYAQLTCGVSGGGWQEASLNLSNFKSTATYVVFRGRERTGSLYYKSDICIDDVIVYNELSPPSCINEITPVDLDTNILINLDLNWQSDAVAEGYRLYLGTNVGASNIYNGINVNNVTSYTLPELSYSTVYYWKIVPYNASGNAAGCEIWDFKTQRDPTINTFPWTESFGSDFSYGWVNDDDDESEVEDWMTGIPGNGTNPVQYGATQDHTSGTGYVAWVDDSNSPQSDTVNLVTPPLNIASLAQPILSFWYWIGDVSTRTSMLYIDIYDEDTDVWTNNVVSLSDNGEWTEREIDLTAYKSAGTKIRFRASEDMIGSEYKSDVAIDDILVYTYFAKDVGVVAITEPVESSLNFTATEDITVKVFNYGIASQSNIPVYYRVNEGTPVSETITGPLAPGDTISYTFTSNVDLTVGGTYVFDAWAVLSGEEDNDNDSLTGYSVFSFGSNVSPRFVGQKVINTTYSDYHKGVVQTSDGGFAVVGYASRSPNTYQATVYRLDLDGNKMWSNNYGGSAFEHGNCIRQTSDDGFIVTGYTKSYGDGIEDVFLVKLDTGGVVEWTKAYGGASADVGHCVEQTDDGGYIVVGTTKSDGAGYSDVYLIKTNSTGDTLWTRIYGSNAYEDAWSVEQTADGGYVIGGYSSGYSAVGSDYYLLKTDADGDVEWSYTYGGTGTDKLRDVLQSSDGGYIMVGESNSFSDNGTYASYLVKVDADGDEEWSRTLGGANNDYATAVVEAGGGFVVLGYTRSFGEGMNDVSLIKTDALGYPIWSKTYGGINDEYSCGLCKNVDQGFMIAGYTKSFAISGSDIYLVRTNKMGYAANCNQADASMLTTTPTTTRAVATNAIEFGAVVTSPTMSAITNAATFEDITCENLTVNTFQKGFEGPGSDYGYSVAQTSDGGYVSVGKTASFGQGGYDLFAVKTDVEGVTEWSRTYGSAGTDIGYAVVATDDDGIMMLGQTSGGGPGDFYLIKTDLNGDTLWTKMYGGTSTDCGLALAKTSDGGYILAGETQSYDVESTDMYFIRIDEIGDTLWTRSVGGGLIESCRSVTQIANGGFIACGYSNGYGVDVYDFMMVCLDADGVVLWSKLYGGNDDDKGYSVKQTADGGYILAGYTESNASSVEDFLMIKTDSDGDTVWTKTYGGTGQDIASSVFEYNDGGFIIAGYSKSFEGYRPGFLIKTDSWGDEEWSKIYPAGSTNIISSIISATDGGFAFTGYSKLSGESVYKMNISKLTALGLSGACHVQSVTPTVGNVSLTVTSPAISTKRGGLIKSSVTEIGLQNPDEDEYVISYTLTSDNVSCYGGSDAYISLEVSGGIEPYTFSWSDGNNDENRVNILADTYIIEVSGDNDCEFIDTVVITQPDLMTTSIVGFDVHCNGEFDGTATVSVTGGVEPYTYFWSMGQSGETAVDIYPGTYTVNISDMNNCPASNIVTIEEPDVFTMSVVGTDASCNAGADGEATLVLTGGTDPYTVSWSNGESTQEIYGLTAATYTVTVTDSCGISLIDSVSLSQPEALSVNFAISNVSCKNKIDGSLDLTVIGGTEPFTYLWSNSDTTEDVSLLVDGDYIVTVYDACGDSIVDTATVTEPDLLTTTISGTDVTCFGGVDGTATVTPSGGTYPYFYLWNSGQSDSIAIELFPGNQSVNVVDVNGCLSSNSVAINEPDELNISAVGTDATCNSGTDGSIDLTVADGTAPYSYAWSNADIIEDPVGLAANDYTVTVTDACTATKTITITIEEPVSLASTMQITDVGCFGSVDGEIDLTITGGTSPYTYQWSNTETSEDLVSLDNGTYYVTTTDACADSIVDTVIVAEPVLLSTTISSTDLSCNGGGDGTVTVSPSGGTAPYTYSWNNGQADSLAVGLFPGTHSVNVIDVNGCLASNSISVDEPAIMSISLTGSDVTCNGGVNGSVDLTVAGGTTPYTYLWSNADTIEDLVNVVAGAYNVTVTDSCGATQTSSVVLAEPMPLTSTMLINNASCKGSIDGTALVTVSGGTLPYVYSWSTVEILPGITDLAAATYFVTVTDACFDDVLDTAIVEEPDLLTIVVTEGDISCYSEANGTASVVASGGTIPYTYFWSNSMTTSSVTALFPGNYSVNVHDNNGCLASGLATISQPEAMVITSLIATPSNCNGDPIGSTLLDVDNGTLPYDYLWSNGDTTQNLTNVVAGTYTVTVTDSCGYILSQSVAIGEPTELSSNTYVTDVSCKDYQNGMIDLVVSGGTLPYDYLWSDGAITDDITELDTGMYIVRIIDFCNDTIIDTAIVQQPEQLSVTMSKSDVSCYGIGNGSATVSTLGGTVPYSYMWSNGQTDSTAVGLFPANYSVNVVDNNGCLASGLETITQPNPLEISLIGTDNICNGDSAGVANLSVLYGTAPYTYLWSNGDTTEDISSLIADNYTVTVTDSCGAILTASVEISEPDALSSQLLISDVSCKGNIDGEVDLIVLGGTEPFTYAWSNTEITEDISSLSLGEYYVTVGDACSKTIKDTAIVNEPVLLTTTITQTNVNCNGGGDGTATIIPSGGTSPYTYFWSSNQSVAVAVGLFPGNHMVNVIDVNGCLASNNTVITEPAAMSISVIGDSVNCNGGNDGSIDLSVYAGTSPYMYSWSNGDTTEDVSGLVAGTYTISVTDSCGAIQIASLEIYEPDVLSSQMQITDVSCNGYSNGAAVVLPLGGTAPYGFNWSHGDVTSAISSKSTGEYYVVITDACSDLANDTAIIAEPELLTTTIYSTDVSCYGGGNGIAIITPTGGTTPYTYLWNNNRTDSLADGLFPGSYSVNVFDANGCLASGITSIGEPEMLSVSLVGTDNVCRGASYGSIALIATAGTTPYTYLWSNGDTTKDVSELAADTYTVTITDSCGVITTNTITIGEPDELISSKIITQVSCNGKSDGAVDLMVYGGTGVYTYNWSNGSSSQDLSNISSDTYVVVVSDGCNSVSDTAEVSQPEQLIADITSTNISCNSFGNGTATVDVTGGVEPYSYMWNNRQNTSMAIGLFPGNYSVNVFDANNCLASDIVTITEPTALELELSVIDATCGNADGIVLSEVSGGTSPYSYLWSDSTVKPVHVDASSGDYSLSVTDALNCVITESISVSIVAPVPEICVVTVGPETGYNVVTWDKSDGYGISGYNIYKQSNYTGNYDLVRFVPVDSISLYVDYASKPKQQSDRYRISATDTCGNESELSSPHKTMHLTSNVGLNKTINLIWENYYGIDFANYYIYRGTHPDSLKEIGSIQSDFTSYTDVNPPLGVNLYYQVSINLPYTCAPARKANETGPYGQSISNMEDAGKADLGGGLDSTSGQFENEAYLKEFKAYPNPYHGKTMISYTLEKHSSVRLEVFNVLGEKIDVIENKNQTAGVYNYEFDSEALGLSAGVYYLHLSTDDLLSVIKLVQTK